jgi:hypothetical protein
MNLTRTFIREGREEARSKPGQGHVLAQRLLRRHKQIQTFAFLRVSSRPSRIAFGFPE